MTTVWVPDRRWTADGEGRKCRHGASPGKKACGEPAVAVLKRTAAGGGRSWTVRWAYCADHLYGRKIKGGQVLRAVSAESPAAERGYVG